MKPWFHRWVPWSLVGLRLALGPTAVLIAWAGLPRWLWLLQFVVAALSDVYDGKLARRWGTVTAGLRQADSIVDTVYTLGVGASMYLAEPLIWAEHQWAIALVIGLEGARYPLDWIRFGRGASYHAKSAKLFGLSLVPATIAVMGFGYAGPLLWLSLTIGVLSELEGMAISMVLPRWTHDVPHLGAALAIRREASAMTSGSAAP
jgi:CDP-diacylglycerol--glycerol-3-phosphate 3-phosphatidyltransferase